MERSKTQTNGVRPRVLLAIGAIVVALLVAKFSGVFDGSKPAEIAGVTPSQQEPGPQPGVPQAPSTRPKPIPATGPLAAPPVAPVAIVPGTPDAAGDWSAKLDEVLGSAEAESLKAERLLAMWPGLPPDGQVELMQHITNLLPDDKFGQLHNTFTNAQTHEEVLDVLMTDVLNRPNGIKLPSLLDVARSEGHPKAEEAREILEVFVDENHGTDWAKWEKAVQDWLKENPDEAPEAPEGLKGK